ncbi:hypothetical protein VP01_1709g5 [Puccinia sorghi]|uniref:Uncharacterized protein n=1 Tax=Puccinia sorghi TaxID=27349 RepID=A0A0L6VFK3_9BASI|nr:hypothetical protein VP01_1709g5 [Puccinia sorghi]
MNLDHTAARKFNPWNDPMPQNLNHLLKPIQWGHNPFETLLKERPPEFITTSHVTVEQEKHKFLLHFILLREQGFPIPIPVSIKDSVEISTPSFIIPVPYFSFLELTDTIKIQRKSVVCFSVISSVLSELKIFSHLFFIQIYLFIQFFLNHISTCFYIEYIFRIVTSNLSTDSFRYLFEPVHFPSSECLCPNLTHTHPSHL